ncbi:MAG: glycosyltransferase family 2 protein, partial [Candidatus Hodarchaeota archaeon]
MHSQSTNLYTTNLGPKPDLSVSIVNYNTTDYLIRCLDSIKYHSDDLKTEILIVDNASDDFQAEKIHQLFPEAVITVNKENEGFAYAQNQNFALSKADYFLLLNPDTMLPQGALNAIIETFQRFHEVAIVGPNIISPEGRSLVNVRDFPTLKSALWELLYFDKVVPRNNSQDSSFDTCEFQYVNCITGAAFAVRSRIYRALGGLDESFFMYFEEVDFCRRMTNTLHQRIVLLPR